MQLSPIYKCPQCGRECSSEEDAKFCLKKCLKKVERQELVHQEWEKECDFIRMNATSLSHIKDLLIEKFQEWWGIELVINNWDDLKFSECMSNSHKAPYGKSTNWCGKNLNVPKGYPGWYCDLTGTTSKGVSFIDLIEGSYTSNYKSKSSISPIVRGITTGCGGGGGRSEGGKYSFRYKVEIWLENFPILQEKYNRYIKLRAKKFRALTTYKERISNAEEKLTNIVESDESYIYQVKYIQKLTQQLAEAHARLEVINQDIRTEYSDIMDKAKKLPKKYSFDIEVYRSLGEDLKMNT